MEIEGESSSSDNASSIDWTTAIFIYTHDESVIPPLMSSDGGRLALHTPTTVIIPPRSKARLDLGVSVRHPPNVAVHVDSNEHTKCFLPLAVVSSYSDKASDYRIYVVIYNTEDYPITLLRGSTYFDLLLYSGRYEGVVVRTTSLHELTRPDFNQRLLSRKHAYPYLGGFTDPSPLPPFARRHPTPYPQGGEEEEAVEDEDVDSGIFDRDSPLSPPLSQNPFEPISPNAYDDYYHSAQSRDRYGGAGRAEDEPFTLPELGTPLELPVSLAGAAASTPETMPPSPEVVELPPDDYVGEYRPREVAVEFRDGVLEFNRENASQPIDLSVAPDATVTLQSSPSPSSSEMTEDAELEKAMAAIIDEPEPVMEFATREGELQFEMEEEATASEVGRE